MSREDVTIMSELSIGVAIAVTQSVWALIVPRRTRDSAIFRVCDVMGGGGVGLLSLGVWNGGEAEGEAKEKVRK